MRVFVGLLAATLVADASEAQTVSEQPSVTDMDQLEWGPPITDPRFPLGGRTAQLGTDPEHGGPTYLAKFPVGSHYDLHWHSHAEYVFVVEGRGTIVLGDESHTLSAGSYIVIPADEHHSWDVPADGRELVILVRRSGPPDFHFVDPESDAS